MTKPKYKIGDCVIAKGWHFYNLFIVCGAYWDDNEWQYTLGRLQEGWFRAHHIRGELEIVTYFQETK